MIRYASLGYLLLAATFLPQTLSADWKDDIGYTRLKSEEGNGLESGIGVLAAIAEAFVSGNYLPNTADPQFSGKTFTDASGIASGTSGHATSVAKRFLGNTDSISGGVSNITLYQADDWLERVMGWSTGRDPDTQNFHIINNSWIGNLTDNNVAVDALNRVDFMVDRDDVLVISGSSNTNNGPVPDLLGHGYNAMIVGRTDGNHGAGLTTFNGAGRVKPDIVAPATSSSIATPTVASAAALLREKAAGTDAVRSETTRAILMAGATKDEFATWDRTTTRPLDEEFGAGELNVYNSYQILKGGSYDASSAEPTFSVGMSGWSYVAETSADESLFYTFEISSLETVTDLSISLNWNLKVSDQNASPDVFDPITSLVNLDMHLFDSTGAFLSSLIDESISDVDNVEYLYLSELGTGTYTLQITANGVTDFGLAWHGSLTAVPEPSALAVLGTVSLGWSLRRVVLRRRKSQSIN